MSLIFYLPSSLYIRYHPFFRFSLNFSHSTPILFSFSFSPFLPFLLPTFPPSSPSILSTPFPSIPSHPFPPSPSSSLLLSSPLYLQINSNMYLYVRWLWIQFPWLALHRAVTCIPNHTHPHSGQRSRIHNGPHTGPHTDSGVFTDPGLGLTRGPNTPYPHPYPSLSPSPYPYPSSYNGSRGGSRGTVGAQRGLLGSGHPDTGMSRGRNRNSHNSKNMNMIRSRKRNSSLIGPIRNTTHIPVLPPAPNLISRFILPLILSRSFPCPSLSYSPPASSSQYPS